MFERYTENARRTIFFARYEASSRGSSYIEVVHLLLGLLRESPSIFQPLDRAVLLQKLEGICPKSKEKIATSVDLPLSMASKRALVYASEEAERMGHRHIGTEHLALGVLRENGQESWVLAESGLRLESLRESLRSEAPGPPDLQEAVNRKVARALLAEVPDDRLEAVVRLLAGLGSSGFFKVTVESPAGSFSFSFGPPPAEE